MMTEKQPHEYNSEVWGLAKLANDSGVPMTLIAKELEVSRASVQQRICEVVEDINGD